MREEGNANQHRKTARRRCPRHLDDDDIAVLVTTGLWIKRGTARMDEEKREGSCGGHCCY
jgi:hypothetical protein